MYFSYMGKNEELCTSQGTPLSEAWRFPVVVAPRRSACTLPVKTCSRRAAFIPKQSKANHKDASVNGLFSSVQFNSLWMTVHYIWGSVMATWKYEDIYWKLLVPSIVRDFRDNTMEKRSPISWRLLRQHLFLKSYLHPLCSAPNSKPLLRAMQTGKREAVDHGTGGWLAQVGGGGCQIRTCSMSQNLVMWSTRHCMHRRFGHTNFLCAQEREG